MKTYKYILFGFLGIIGLIIGFTFVNIITKPAQLINKTLETNNIISTYEWYYDNQAMYNVRVNQIKDYKNIVETSEGFDKTNSQIELNALKQTCRTLAEQYNANSNKMNKSIFKDWGLPDTLNPGECE